MFERTPVTREINLSGQEPDRVLAGMLRRLANINMGPLFASFTADLQELHGQYFSRESDPLGNAWAPLAASTVAKKGSDEILVESGNLLGSLAELHHPEAVRDFATVGNQQTMIYGTSIEYAHFHMDGAANMPARPMVGVSPAVVDAMAEQTADYVLGVMVEGAL